MYKRQILNRNIRGRQENLSPLFMVGGIYPIVNPFFLGKVKINSQKEDCCLMTNTIKDVMKQNFYGQKVEEFTLIGLLDGVFANQDEIKEEFAEKVVSIEGFFQKMYQEVKSFYGVV